jgi:membrane protein YqaA with SNARE-associated domain
MMMMSLDRLRTHVYVALIATALNFASPRVADSQTAPRSHSTIRRVIATSTGALLGGTAGYLLGRHYARQSECNGCSANHDGYLGGGLALGAVVGGTVGWYLSRPSTPEPRRVGFVNHPEWSASDTGATARSYPRLTRLP